MWGLACRITGGRVQSSVPGWLASAPATHACIAYMERCAQELAREPIRYDFDPDAAYTVAIQTWDAALSPARSIAFGRDKAGHQAVGLIPDVYYLGSNGYGALRAAAETGLAWGERDATVVWRGSVTGRGPYEGPQDIPRVKLALHCKRMEGVDVKLIGVHDTIQSILPISCIEPFISAHDLVAEAWPMAHFGRFRYVLDIDGYANAWGLLEKLILGCCVLKVETPYEQWFYGRLQPWVHYVPVKGDISDLQEKIAWCRSHEATCQWIAAAGARLAASMTDEAELQRSCEQIMLAAHVAPAS